MSEDEALTAPQNRPTDTPPAGSRWGLERPLSKRARLIGIVGSLILVAAIGGVAVVVSAGEGKDKTVELGAIEDTYTNAARPDGTFGNADKLVAGSQPGSAKVTYLMFDVPTVDTDKHIAAAHLILTREEHKFPATTVSLSAVADTSWKEKTVTSSNAPKLGDVVGTAEVDDNGDAIRFNLRGVVDRGGRYAFAVSAALTDGVVRFRSSESGKNAPKLVLDVKDGAASAGPKPKPEQPSPTSTVIGGPGAPSPTTEPKSAPGGKCAVSDKLVPACGRWLGVAPLAHTKVPRPAALADFEKRLGGPVDIMHTYHTGGQLFPNEAERKMATEPGRNRLLLINWKPSGTWAQVAAGKSDAQIDKLAAHITSTFKSKFFLAIYHEPEDNVVDRAGSGMQATDYRAMFRHTVQRLRAKGVTNAVIVMNYMGAPKWGIQPWFNSLYPGDDVVDWVAYDPYAMGQPGSHDGDFAEMVNRTPNGNKWPGMYNWLTKNHPGKPVMLGEWGVGEYSQNPSVKAKFFEQLSGQLAKFPAIKALVYFDAPNAAPFGDTRISSSSQALAAYRKMANAPAIAAAPPPSVR